MKLVQMPVELLHLTVDDLPDLGLEAALVAEFRRYLDRDPAGLESLAILAPPEAGSRALLMVLARRIGAALRDANIHLRDRGGDLATHRQKLCYLPGPVLPEALRTPTARRTLERETAVFFQDLDAAWQAEQVSVEPLPPVSFLTLLETRASHQRPTFLTADPRALPRDLPREIRARMRTLEPGGNWGE
jgi:hypothetical protein